MIGLLREALGDDRLNPTYIQTVHRRGYRFVAPVQTLQRPAAPAAPRLAAPAALAAPTAPAADPWRPLVACISRPRSPRMIAIAIVFALFGQRPSEPRPTMRFTIALPENTAIDPLRGSVAVSPTARGWCMRAAQEAGRGCSCARSIATRRRRSTDPMAPADPFFSPDGEWIGFFAHGSLKKIARRRRHAGRDLCAARAGAGASWARDGTIVFGGGPGGGARARLRPGRRACRARRACARVTRGELRLAGRHARRAGRDLHRASLADSAVAVLDLTTGGSVTRSSRPPRLAATRRPDISCSNGAAGWKRQRFALGELDDSPPNRVRSFAAWPPPARRWRAHASRSRARDRWCMCPGASTDTDERLHWMDADGRLRARAAARPRHSAASTSRQTFVSVAVTVEGDNGHDLWVGDLDRGALSRLSADGQSVSPAWRPDGLEIAFAYSKAGPFNLFVRPTDGGSTPQPLLESPWNQFPTSWSRNGRLLAFTEVHPLTGADIWLLDLRIRERRQVVRTLFDESYARFSPDGRWLAYMSNESGRWDVFIRAVDGSRPRGCKCPSPAARGHAGRSTAARCTSASVVEPRRLRCRPTPTLRVVCADVHARAETICKLAGGARGFASRAGAAKRRRAGAPRVARRARVVLRAHAARSPAGVTRIESLADPRVAAYHNISNPDALLRGGLFVAEGRLVVRRLLANPRFRTHSVLVTDGRVRRAKGQP